MKRGFAFERVGVHPLGEKCNDNITILRSMERNGYQVFNFLWTSLILQMKMVFNGPATQDVSSKSY